MIRDVDDIEYDIHFHQLPEMPSAPEDGRQEFFFCPFGLNGGMFNESMLERLPNEKRSQYANISTLPGP